MYLEVPKKNGKSTLLSALAIELELADGEPARRYLNAVRSRAGRDRVRRIGTDGQCLPELASRLEVIPSKGVIVDPKNDGKIKKNSADAPSKDGVNASTWFFDELHRFKNRDVYDIFRYAGASGSSRSRSR